MKLSNTVKKQLRKRGYTKQVRMAYASNERQEAKLTPTKSDAMLFGYAKIMAVLGRGCDVQAA